MIIFDVQEAGMLFIWLQTTWLHFAERLAYTLLLALKKKYAMSKIKLWKGSHDLEMQVTFRNHKNCFIELGKKKKLLVVQVKRNELWHQTEWVWQLIFLQSSLPIRTQLCKHHNFNEETTWSREGSWAMLGLLILRDNKFALFFFTVMFAVICHITKLKHDEFTIFSQKLTLHFSLSSFQYFMFLI